MLGRQVQTSGVAPTDDSFTIIAPGNQDVDQDGEFGTTENFFPYISQRALSDFLIASGPALVGDPDMGFSGLRQFGPPLVHHMQVSN